MTILDHYRTLVATHPSTPSNQTFRELEAERLRLEDERRLRQQSFTFLTTYMDSLAQCKSHGQPEAAQMVSFFDDFVEIGIARSAAISELDTKLADVGNRIKEEKEHLSKLDTGLPVKVVTVLSCNNQVPVEAAELTVTYSKDKHIFQSITLEFMASLVVRQVSWKPTYDLHVAMTGNTPSPTVTLNFRCTVTQWTEENWENVSLVLTTVDRVSQLIQLPEPKRIDISLGPTHGVHQPATALQPQPIVIEPPNPLYYNGHRAMASRGAVPRSEGVEHDRNRNRDHDRDIQRGWDEISAVQLPPAQRQLPYVHAAPPASVVVQDSVLGAPSQTVCQLISHVCAVHQSILSEKLLTFVSWGI